LDSVAPGIALMVGIDVENFFPLQVLGLDAQRNTNNSGKCKCDSN